MVGLDAQYCDNNGKVALQAERCADVIVPKTPDPVLTSCGVVLLFQDPQSRLITFYDSLNFIYITNMLHAKGHVQRHFVIFFKEDSQGKVHCCIDNIGIHLTALHKQGSMHVYISSM